MNQLERRLIEQTIESTRPVSATAATFDSTAGYQANHAEAARLIENADYRRGWDACHERVTEYLQTLLAGDHRTLRQAAGKADRPKGCA